MFSRINHEGVKVQNPSAPSRFWPRLLVWFFPLAFTGLFFFYPLLRILAYSLDLSALTLKNIDLASDALLFTLFQAFLSTLLTLLLGLPSAYLFAGFD